MIFRYCLTVVISAVVFSSAESRHLPDPCEDAKQALTDVNNFVKDSCFNYGLQLIKTSAILDLSEHCIAFGKDSFSKNILSAATFGNKNSGTVPTVANAFADLHNHLNKLPPDAGDLYGLVALCKKNPLYKTRFVVTDNGKLYALLICNRDAAINFANNYPPDKNPLSGFQPTFPEKIVDEFRKIKYEQGNNDEVAITYILEKYNTGILLVAENENRYFELISEMKW